MRSCSCRILIVVALCAPWTLGSVVAVERDLQKEIAALLQSAQKWSGTGEFEKAESDSREALGISLDQLGALYAALGDNEPAAEAYGEAVRASVSASSSALLGLGILDLRRGEYVEGIQTISKILELNPLHPEARHVLGKIHFMQGDFDQAASELQDSYQIRSDDTSVAYTLALTYLKLGKIEAARDLFAELVHRLGDSARLHVLFGRALRATEYLDEAVVEFRKAIEMDPSVPRVHSYLGLTYLLQKDSAGFPEAIREFEAEIANDPASYFGHFYLGVIFNQNRENKKAAFHLRKAVESDPENPDARLHLGQALFQDGDLEAAVAAMRQCIALTRDPSHNKYQVSNAHYVLGRSLQRMGRADEAKRELELAQELKARRASEESQSLQTYLGGPSSADEGTERGSIAQLAAHESKGGLLDEPVPDEEAQRVLRNTVAVYRTAAAKAYESLARLETLRDDFPAAARFLRQALHWDDSLPDGFFNLGLALTKSGELAAAVPPLIQACQRNPEKAGAAQMLANAALKLVEGRQTEPASEAVSFLLKRNPNVAELWLLEGHLAAQKSRFEEAVKAYREALSRNTKLPEAHYSIGTALIRTADFDGALLEFEAELKLNPEHAGALYHKAFILLSQQRTDEAIELLQRVVQIDRNYADAYYQLGKAQLEGGQLLLAQANLETAAHLSPNASHIFYQLSRAYNQAARQEDAKRAFERYRTLKKAEEENRLSRMKEQPPNR